MPETPILVDHFPAYWDEELPPFPTRPCLPVQCLCLADGPKNSCYTVNLNSGGLQRGQGPADGHQDEDQQHHHHHDLHVSRAAKR